MHRNLLKVTKSFCEIQKDILGIPELCLGNSCLCHMCGHALINTGLPVHLPAGITLIFGGRMQALYI